MRILTDEERISCQRIAREKWTPTGKEHKDAFLWNKKLAEVNETALLQTQAALIRSDIEKIIKDRSNDYSLKRGGSGLEKIVMSIQSYLQEAAP